LRASACRIRLAWLPGRPQSPQLYAGQQARSQQYMNCNDGAWRTYPTKTMSLAGVLLGIGTCGGMERVGPRINFSLAFGPHLQDMRHSAIVQS